MATGPESVQGIVCQLSTSGTGSSGPLGRKDNNKPLAVTHEVRAPLAAYSAVAHGFCQIPTQGIETNIQGAEKNTSNIKCIPGPAKTTVIAIGSANTAMSQLDSINSTYLQPLRIFNAVVTSIANVRSSKARWSNSD